MAPKAGIEVVREIYAALARGDLAQAMSCMADTARWDFNVRGSEVPWHRPATGPAEIEGLLRTFSEHTSIQTFEPTAYIGSGDEVAVHVRMIYTVKKTGRIVDGEQLNWWSVRDGLVIRLRHFEDTDQVLSAWRDPIH